ncbi:hypothetical protein [Pedobacter kyungheensis]|nr:hypothetical protein [Pedobacter kyungheensis]
MNVLILVFNRVYFVLQKVGNQSPFIGAVILVTLLISSIVFSIWLSVFAFKVEALHLLGSRYFSIIFIIFIILYLFANKHKEKITNDSIEVSPIKGIYVLSLFILALLAFIFLSNINREKMKGRNISVNKGKYPSIERDISK